MATGQWSVWGREGDCYPNQLQYPTSKWPLLFLCLLFCVRVAALTNCPLSERFPYLNLNVTGRFYQIPSLLSQTACGKQKSTRT